MPPPKKNIKPKEKRVTYSIYKIELLKQFINCPPDIDYHLGEKLKSSFEIKLSLYEDSQIVGVIINHKFFFDGILLLELEVQNDFKTKNVIEGFVDENNRFKDTDFIVFIVTLSTSHLRGIQAFVTKDSPIASFYTPFPSRDKILNSISERVVIEKD